MAGEGVAALGDTGDDAVNAVENLGGNEEVGGGMVVDGEVGDNCSYFFCFSWRGWALASGTGSWRCFKPEGRGI